MLCISLTNKSQKLSKALQYLKEKEHVAHVAQLTGQPHLASPCLPGFILNDDVESVNVHENPATQVWPIENFKKCSVDTNLKKIRP